MKKFLEKLKLRDLPFPLWKTGVEGSMDSPESGWSPKLQEEEKRGISLSRWLLVALPLISFLSLGIYFIVADVKLLTSVVEKDADPGRNSSETWWLHTSDSLLQREVDRQGEEATSPPETYAEEDEEDPNLIVHFDYVDLSSEDGRFIENVLAPGNDSRETIIILKNDDSGKKIFLKGTGGKSTSEKESTTAKAFVYSPTIPQASPKRPRVDATTKKYNTSEDSGCFSTKLSFCEGILPYDVVQLPNLPGVKRYADLEAVLPYFQMIVDSGCSLRAKEFICSVLEPECHPEGLKQTLPCKLNCKVVSDDCKDFILQTLPLSKIFDCRKYPDWGENQDCLNVSKGKCHDEEFRCSDGTCIPLKWVCDGVHDCPGSRPSFDENNCQGCSENEFRCVMDGKCVPLHWKCDGQIDCADHSDEMSC